MATLVTSMVLTKVVALDFGMLFDQEPTLKKDSRSSAPFCILQQEESSASLYLFDVVAEVFTALSILCIYDRSPAVFRTLHVAKSSSSSIEETCELLTGIKQTITYLLWSRGTRKKEFQKF